MTLEEYISAHSTPENEVLEAITRDTHIHVLNAHMLSGHVQGRALSMISHMIRPHRILELGTFTGYSALCLAEGLDEDGQLITIDHNDELEDTIRRNFARSPLGKKITLLIGDAKEILTSKLSTSNSTLSSLMPTNANTANISNSSARSFPSEVSFWRTTRSGTGILSTAHMTVTNKPSDCASSTINSPKIADSNKSFCPLGTD